MQHGLEALIKAVLSCRVHYRDNQDSGCQGVSRHHDVPRFR